ncbi:hypothetical protein C8R46DRAFT_1083163 [Mycena filopes]|nr:hypothetical protein C8R46DRAFT_1083163 [Mycena filopes]
MFGRGKLSNLEVSLMMADLKNPNSTTRSCTQCQREVPKTQKLLTCDRCRESKKQQKLRKKERDIAIAEGRGAGANEGFSSAPLQAVIAKQEQETAAKRAARKPKDSSTEVAKPTAGASSSRNGMGMVMQAILNEHERDERASKPLPKKRATKKKADALGGDLNELSALLLFDLITNGAFSSESVAGTKRKREEVEEYEPNLPGTVYDAETAKKRWRGDMPMPRLEPIPGTRAAISAQKTAAKPVASSSKTSTAATSKSKSLPLRKETSNIPPAPKVSVGAKRQKVQGSLAGWVTATPKSTA